MFGSNFNVCFERVETRKMQNILKPFARSQAWLPGGSRLGRLKSDSSTFQGLCGFPLEKTMHTIFNDGQVHENIEAEVSRILAIFQKHTTSCLPDEYDNLNHNQIQ